MLQPCKFSATNALHLMSQRKLSARELMESCLDRIDEREGEVQAWQYIDRAHCLAQADACDSGSLEGPLHGIPVGIKDIIDTAQMPTGYGTSIYNGHQPMADAACVARIQNAGGIIMGKTVTTELAYFRPGKTRNPYNTARTPGGSSSGSAAAVADCMVPFALGTQTAASLTRPSAYCGIAGYKASVGSYSLSGIKCFSQYLDSMGIMARSVSDIALLGSVMSGIDTEIIPLSNPPRLAYCETSFASEADTQMKQRLTNMVNDLRKNGAVVDVVDAPDEFARGVELHKTIMAFEAARNYSFEYLNHQDQLSEPLVDLLETGDRCSLKDYQSARLKADYCRALYAEHFNSYDAVLTYSATGEAPLASSGTGNPIFSRLWTLLGVPSVTMPVGVGANGMPLGVQLVGKFNADNALLNVVSWIESTVSQEE